MGHLQDRQKQLSLRRLCKLLAVRRSTVYEVRRGADRFSSSWHTDEEIIAMMKKVRAAHQTWGFRLILSHLKQVKGEQIGKTRAYRLYQAAKMSLHKTPKKPRIKREFQELLPPKYINEGWAMDFLSEWVIGEKQQAVRIINVVDECSRKDLWIEAAFSITAKQLTDTLDKLTAMRGCPRYIRCDNGPEFISQTLQSWASTNNVELKFIQPGKPTQNGIIERLNGTARRECLNLNWFNSLEELNELLGEWYKTYNFDRPHSSLKYKTPVAFEKSNMNLYFRMVPATEG